MPMNISKFIFCILIFNGVSTILLAQTDSVPSEKIKIEYKNTDIRFTKKSDKEFFAIVMDRPENEIVIKSLSTQLGVLNSKILKIELLGSKEKIKWVRNEKGLVIQSPKNFSTEYAHAFKIILEGYTENNIGGNVEDHVD